MELAGTLGSQSLSTYPVTVFVGKENNVRSSTPALLEVTDCYDGLEQVFQDFGGYSCSEPWMVGYCGEEEIDRVCKATCGTCEGASSTRRLGVSLPTLKKKLKDHFDIYSKWDRPRERSL